MVDENKTWTRQNVQKKKLYETTSFRLYETH